MLYVRLAGCDRCVDGCLCQIYEHCAEIDISGLKDPRLHEHTKISALYNLGRLMADQDRHQVSTAHHLTLGTRGPVTADDRQGTTLNKISTENA